MSSLGVRDAAPHAPVDGLDGLPYRALIEAAAVSRGVISLLYAAAVRGAALAAAGADRSACGPEADGIAARRAWLPLPVSFVDSPDAALPLVDVLQLACEAGYDAGAAAGFGGWTPTDRMSRRAMPEWLRARLEAACAAARGRAAPDAGIGRQAAERGPSTELRWEVRTAAGSRYWFRRDPDGRWWVSADNAPLPLSACLADGCWRLAAAPTPWPPIPGLPLRFDAPAELAADDPTRIPGGGKITARVTARRAVWADADVSARECANRLQTRR
jgi:hypothetical protein